MKNRFSPSRCCCTNRVENPIQAQGCAGAIKEAFIEVFTDAGLTSLDWSGYTSGDPDRIAFPSFEVGETYYIRVTSPLPRFVATVVEHIGAAGPNPPVLKIPVKLASGYICNPYLSPECDMDSRMIPVPTTLYYSDTLGNSNVPIVAVPASVSPSTSAGWFGNGQADYPAYEVDVCNCPASPASPVKIGYRGKNIYLTYYGKNIIHCPGGAVGRPEFYGGGATITVEDCPPEMLLSLSGNLGAFCGYIERGAPTFPLPTTFTGTITEQPSGPMMLASAPLPEPPKGYPPIGEQIINATKAAGRFVASGLAVVDQEEFDRRKAICQKCPTSQYVAAEDRCLSCGCHLSVKPWSKAETCPHGHWRKAKGEHG